MEIVAGNSCCDPHSVAIAVRVLGSSFMRSIIFARGSIVNKPAANQSPAIDAREKNVLSRTISQVKPHVAAGGSDDVCWNSKALGNAILQRQSLGGERHVIAKFRKIFRTHLGIKQNSAVALLQFRKVFSQQASHRWPDSGPRVKRVDKYRVRPANRPPTGTSLRANSGRRIEKAATGRT